MMRVGKDVYSASELREMGYPDRLIRTLVKSDHFPEFGFRLGTGRTSKAFFILPKMTRFIECQMDDFGEVRG